MDASLDPWRLIRHSHDRAGFAQDESLFALANGALGVRGGLEEDASPSQASFLAGVWERSPIDYHERFPGFARHTDTRVPVVDGTGIRLFLDGEPVLLDQGEWLDFARELDLRHGCLRRTLRWLSPAGATLEIRAERLVPLDCPGLLAIRYRLRSIDYRGSLRLESRLAVAHGATAQGDDPRIGARVAGGLKLQAAGADAAQAWVSQRTTHSAIALVCAQRHRIGGELRFDSASHDAEGARQSFHGELVPGQELALEKFVAYAWTTPDARHDQAELLDQAQAQLAEATRQGHASLQAAQSRTLETFWNRVDLAIHGDPRSEQALRFNLFHVLQSTSRDDRASSAAKGLTGEGYEGHYFWDAEAFMLPALVLAAPERARAMLGYRHRTLEQARRHARELNHPRGALYAWRTISGDECSAYFPSGSAQYHINAAIAWAIRLYVDASGDEAFLREQGAEILIETARIWLEAGHFEPRRGGAFCINAITGPDEYSALVDNNHYTNRMAQRHLRDAAATVAWLRERHPASHAELAARIELREEEIADWRRAADAMYLPLDPALGIFPQDDAFLDKPRLPLRATHGAGKQPLLLRMHPLTLYRHQVCKQADTVLALVLAGEQVDRATKRRNLDYYEGVTVHDSTLSAGSFGILAAEVGDGARAWRYFGEAARVDLDDLHGNAAHGVHMASMAGSWLALLWGFGGLRVLDGKPALAPSLPAAWSGYRFGLRWRDAQLRVEVGADGARYTLCAGEALDFLHLRQPVHLTRGQSVLLPRADQAGQLRGVVFDLDGVLADTAVVHEAAWRQLAREIGIPFPDGIGERLKGVDRMASLEILLESAGRDFDEAQKQALAARKNTLYIEAIRHFGPEQLLPGARAALLGVRRAGLKVALASASKNAPLLLERLGIAELFDHVVDARQIARAKPDPEIFLAAAAGLGLPPPQCLGVEDAAAGVAAIRAAGMRAVGIGDPTALAAAETVLPDVVAFDIGHFISNT